MRPTRVSVEGFSAYRGLVEVDFAGVDFFSLSGPTGSGKSSLIDAMVFALFGRVPRLGGNAVAPAITAGADRARVRLDFVIGDTEYTVARVAQRTPSGGASVKEARLEQGDQVLASGADDVTTAVEEVLKLRFDDFTRTVVLPQGDFARFLNATKAERQGLLRNLLGMDVYTTVRELAKTRAAVATERAEGARRVLESLRVADEDEIAAATQRRDDLSLLAESMIEREKTLVDFARNLHEAESRSAALAGSVERLSGIEAPSRLVELDTLIAAARSAVVEAEEARQSAAESLLGAESAMQELPPESQISAWMKGRLQLAEVEDRLADPAAEEAKKTAVAVRERLDSGLVDLERVRTDLHRARSVHASHLLAANLAVGEPCPVCSQEVNEVPELLSLPELDGLIEEEARLMKRVESLRTESDVAGTEVTRLEAMNTSLEERRQALIADLGDAPAGDDLAGIAEELARLAGAREAAREELARLETEEKKAHTALEDLADDGRRVAKQLTTAQLKVADLEPPVSESDDVVVQWKELIEWREQTLDRLRSEMDSAKEAVIAANESAARAHQELVVTLETHGIEPREPFAVQVGTALHEARALVDAQTKAAEDAAELAEKERDAVSEAAVADALANHLRANGFEQWLMAGALTDLVSGANALLGQLSGDGYALHSDDSGSFSIVDHRNADEIRSVSTLSGGETFLVSLALALSLAETLASKGGSGLDAIILDEGFGTLDEESLDTVASVLEELTGRGLMVGVITHVKELAARAPVRYEVRREPGGAQVRLVP